MPDFSTFITHWYYWQFFEGTCKNRFFVRAKAAREVQFLHWSGYGQSIKEKWIS